MKYLKLFESEDDYDPDERIHISTIFEENREKIENIMDLYIDTFDETSINPTIIVCGDRGEGFDLLDLFWVYPNKDDKDLKIVGQNGPKATYEEEMYYRSSTEDLVFGIPNPTSGYGYYPDQIEKLHEDLTDILIKKIKSMYNYTQVEKNDNWILFKITEK